MNNKAGSIFNEIFLSDLNPNLTLTFPSSGFPYLTSIDGNMTVMISAILSKSNLKNQPAISDSSEQSEQPFQFHSHSHSHSSTNFQMKTSSNLNQSNYSSISAYPNTSTQPQLLSQPLYPVQPSSLSFPATIPSTPSPSTMYSERSLLKPFLRSTNEESQQTHLVIRNDDILELFEPPPPSLQYVQIDTSPQLVMPSEYFRLLPSLRVISIGEQCLQTTPGLTLHQLPSLRSVRIGSNSFKSTASGKYNVLSICDCPCLLSLTVGEGAFNGCAMVVLQQLANLKEIELYPRCFPLCELVVIRECCTLEQVVFPEQSFSSVNEMQISRREIE